MDPDDESRWRQALEDQGVERVRFIFAENPGHGVGATVHGIVTKGTPPNRGFVWGWIAEKEKEATAANSQIAKATLDYSRIAAWAAVIGIAVAVLIGGASILATRLHP